MSLKNPQFEFLDPPEKSGELGRLGPYRVTGTLGKGGMGQVFLAEDGRLKRRVALKVMNQRFAASAGSKKRFVEEARAMAAVHHDNVATIFEVGLRAGMPFIAMEMLKGKTLERRMCEGAAFTVDEILQVARDVACGLSAAHQCGIIHRDIKPANIWIEQSGRAKILDFGLAIAESSQLAARGTVMGTPGYLSPEQARNEPVDDRTDLYSLGVVLYQMCTGKLPLVADSIPGQMVTILAHLPNPVDQLNDEIPPPLSQLVQQLLEKEPRKRPPSATDLERLINDVADRCHNDSQAALQIVTAPVTNASKSNSKKPASGTQEAEDERSARLPGLGWYPWIAAALLVICIIVAIAVYSQPRRVAGQPAGPSVPANSPPSRPPVRADDLRALMLTPVIAGSPRVTHGDAARFQMLLENTATSERYDPRQRTQGAREAAQIEVKLKNSAGRPIKSPAYPRLFSSRQLPQRGESKKFEIALDTRSLVADDYEVTFELQTPLGVSLRATSTKLTVTENLGKGDLLGFELLRTHSGGADTYVRRNSKEALGRNKLLRIHRHGGGESAVEEHIYLRFDLSRGPVPRSEIDRAVLLLTLAAGSHQGSSKIMLYGLPAELAADWSEAGDGALVWDLAPSRDGIQSLTFLASTTIDNTADVLKNRTDAIRLYGRNLDNFLRDSTGDQVTLVLVRDTAAGEPTAFRAKEGDPESAPALSLRSR